MTRFRGESAEAWAALASLGALFFLITAGTFTSLGVVLPDMVKALQWDWAGAGLGFTLLGLSTGLASLAPTLVIRTLGIRATLGGGALALAAAFLCLARTGGLTAYWTGATLAGLGFALCAIIPGTYVLARAFRRPSTAFGIYFTVGGLGGVAGPWLYFAVIGLGHGWRAYWLVLAAAVTVLGALAILFCRPPAAEGESAAPRPARPSAVYRSARDWTVAAALRTPQFWTVVGAYTTYLLCGVTVNGISVQHLGERGATATLAGGMLSLQALVNALARVGAGVMGERIDPKRLLVCALGALALGVAALATARDLAGMTLYALGVGLGYGVSYLATTVLLLNYFGFRRNLELFSLMCLVSTLASAGPYVAGLVHDRAGGFEGALWAFAGVALLAMTAVAAMRPPAGRQD